MLPLYSQGRKQLQDDIRNDSRWLTEIKVGKGRIMVNMRKDRFSCADSYVCMRQKNKQTNKQKNQENHENVDFCSITLLMHNIFKNLYDTLLINGH